MMKSLVIYYSRTGNTRLCATTVSKLLKADLREIIEKKNRKGVLGYLSAGKDSSLRKKVALATPDYNFEGYNTIIVLSPVWAWNASAPVTTYLMNCDLKGKQIISIASMAGAEGKTHDTIATIVKSRGGNVIGSFSIATAGKKESDLKTETIKNMKEIMKIK